MSNQLDGTLKTIKKLPSVEYLRTIFDYDSDTGLLKWKISTSNRVKAGDIAGYKTKQGYLCVQIENESFYQHRIAWGSILWNRTTRFYRS